MKFHYNQTKTIIIIKEIIITIITMVIIIIIIIIIISTLNAQLRIPMMHHVRFHYNRIKHHRNFRLLKI